MEIKFTFLKSDSLPHLYRYLFLKINDTEIISFYKYTGNSQSVKVLQIFNKKVATLNYRS